jgi:hypothetical protein
LSSLFFSYAMIQCFTFIFSIGEMPKSLPFLGPSIISGTLKTFENSTLKGTVIST